MKANDLRLVLVRYGSDTGLISLAARSILCHTVETNDGGLEWPKGIPVVDFADEGKFTQLLGQDPEEPDHDWDDVLRYVLDHAGELDLIKKPLVTKSHTRIVTMQIACLAQDAQDVKQSMFNEEGRCWYYDHDCPLGPIRVGICIPTAAEEAAAREALDVDEEGEEQP
jgi:hypothetical protein